MKTHYDKICILFNPNSTGKSKENAQKFHDEVVRLALECKLTLTGTKRAGHAEQIAAAYAKTGKKVLLVSSSGDGGYNEVINGALSTAKSKVVTYVLPSGNANDHHRATSADASTKSIVTQQPEAIDVLKVESTIDGKSWTKYAHSYIGFGASPIIGRKITALNVNVINEKIVVARELLKFRYISLRRNNDIRRYSSVLYTTIPRMSKVMRLAQDSSITDGKMEIYVTRYRSPWHFLSILLKSVTIGLSENNRVTHDDFQTTTKTSIQLDGEVYVLDAKADVSVSCLKQRLDTIL